MGHITFPLLSASLSLPVVTGQQIALVSSEETDKQLRPVTLLLALSLLYHTLTKM